jgi:hypothetical protein
MIYADAELHGKTSFKEWASIFSEGLFVMLTVYADETGIHDGADVVVLSGLMDSRGHWEKFDGKWRKVLKKYDADFFHYREFRKKANTKPGDPYYGWPDEKRRDFLFELAMLVGESAIPTGGMYPTTHNKKIGINNKPFDATINAFFNSTLVTLNMHWPEYDGRVHFIFDEAKNKREWTGPLTEIHKKFRDKDSRIGGISFGNDKKDPEHIALQAADFSAIHLRNETLEYVTVHGGSVSGGIFDMGIIDFIVSKNVDPMFRNLPKEKTKK